MGARESNSGNMKGHFSAGHRSDMKHDILGLVAKEKLFVVV